MATCCCQSRGMDQPCPCCDDNHASCMSCPGNASSWPALAAERQGLALQAWLQLQCWPAMSVHCQCAAQLVSPALCRHNRCCCNLALRRRGCGRHASMPGRLHHRCCSWSVQHCAGTTGAAAILRSADVAVAGMQACLGGCIIAAAAGLFIPNTRCKDQQAASGWSSQCMDEAMAEGSGVRLPPAPLETPLEWQAAGTEQQPACR